MNSPSSRLMSSPSSRLKQWPTMWWTLETSFPPNLLPRGMEKRKKEKIRRKLRDLGNQIVFPPEDPWEEVLEFFGIAAIDKLHNSYGDSPWFWVVAWPAVIGAAAVHFWPDCDGEPIERHAIASVACAAHLQQLLKERSLENTSGRGTLPAPVVLGLRAIERTSLPGLPNITTETIFNEFEAG